MNATITLLIAVLALAWPAFAVEYPYPPFREGRMDPQATGWPLTEEERAFVLKAEHERRPGRESNKHLPEIWPVIPSAGFWGGTSWLDTHEKLVNYVRANPGPCDVLLVGDSITQQWGSPLDKGVLNAAWQKHFASYRTINLGIGGDKSQNVLWRLDHGGVEGLQPKVVVVMIGNNNMFFAPETGVEAAAKGVQMCVTNLRGKFPDAEIIAAKILPCHAPGVDFYENIRKTNAAIETLKLGSDPKVHVLDLWGDFTNADGSIRKPLFGSDSIHLSLDGYAVYAARLKPLLDQFLGGKGLGGKVNLPGKRTSAAAPVPRAASVPTDTSVPDSVSDAVLKPTARTADGKAPWGEGWGFEVGARDLAWLSSPWKLVQQTDGSRELYDLTKDPSETKNLAADQQDIVAKLAAEWEKTMAGVKLRGGPGRPGPGGEGRRRNLTP